MNLMAFITALIISLIACTAVPAAEALAGGPQIWFSDIESAAPLAAGDAEMLTRFAASAILSKEAPAAAPNVSPAVREDRQNRIVFLSISSGQAPARVFLGAGRGIVDAVGQALSSARAGLNDRYGPQWVKLDFVQDVYLRKGADPSQPLPFSEKFYGAALDKETGAAFLPEELIPAGLSGKELRPDSESVAGRLQEVVERRQTREPPRSGSASLHFFTTVSAFCDDEECFPLTGGHRMFKQVSREELLSAARLGGSYLRYAVNPGGRFAYIYHPESNTVSENYNIIRHAGTIYAMLEAYEVTRDRDLLNACRKAIDYLLRHAQPCPANSEIAACIVEDGYTKLGGNALAVLALAKYITVTGDRSHMPMLAALGNRIISSQDKRGEFFIQKQSYPDGTIEDYESEYYPGEALFALMRIYALDPRPLWLNAAERGARRQIRRNRWPWSWKTSHDHWFLYALNELYRFRPDVSYLDQAMRIADAIMRSQNRGSDDPDQLGGYLDHPRSTAAATHTEGLCAAYQMARDFNRPEEAKKMLEAIRLGADFLLQMQFRPESVMYFDAPQRALGGFRNGLDDTDVRIDFVQHNLSSILGLYRILGADQSQAAFSIL